MYGFQSGGNVAGCSVRYLIPRLNCFCSFQSRDSEWHGTSLMWLFFTFLEQQFSWSFLQQNALMLYLCIYFYFSEHFYFYFLIFIGVQLLYNVVLVSAVQQSESAICIHISPVFWISFPFRSEHNAIMFQMHQNGTLPSMLY